MENLIIRPSRSNSHWSWIAKAAAFVVVVIVILQIIPSGSPHVSLPTWTSHKPEKQEPESHEGQRAKSIPNYVHFVNLVENPTEPKIHMELYQFIAIYSAYHYLCPEKIYIHTDVAKDLIEKAWMNSTDPYIQALHKIPNVQINYHTAPNQTTGGKKIDKLPNRSDFVRTDVLKKYGGIFLDEDAYVLRDLAPFRHTGFDMVTARQVDGQICPAVMLSTPGNKLITAYHTLQDKIFDGGWATHATDLLTTLVKDFTEPDYQSLVLPRDTFFPGSWWSDDIKWMYENHDDEGKNVYNNPPTTNLTYFIQNFNLRSPETWQTDLRPYYVMHGWNSGIGFSFNSEDRAKLFGHPDGQISLDYVLARRSNFARAVYPAVKKAMEEGYIGKQDEKKPAEEKKEENKEG